MFSNLGLPETPFYSQVDKGGRSFYLLLPEYDRKTAKATGPSVNTLHLAVVNAPKHEKDRFLECSTARGRFLSSFAIGLYPATAIFPKACSRVLQKPPQEFSDILWKPTFRYRVHKRVLLHPILRQMNKDDRI